MEISAPMSVESVSPPKEREPHHRRIERGIRRDRYGWEGYITTGGRTHWRRFPASTPIEAVRLWRQHMRDGHVAVQAQQEVINLPRSMKGWCYVYFVSAGDAVKVGRTVNMQQRLSELQTASSMPLTLLVAVPAHALLESAIHEHFKHLRIGNGEWFALTDEVLAFVNRLRGGINPVRLLW